MRGGTPQNRKTSTRKKRYPCLQRRKVIPRNRILILRFHFFTFLQQLFQVRVFGYSTIKRLGNRLSPTIFFTAFSLPLPASGRLWGGSGRNYFYSFSHVWKPIQYFDGNLFTSVKSDSIFCWKPFHECEEWFSILLDTFSRVWKAIQYFVGYLFTSVKSDSIFWWNVKKIHLCLIFAYWYGFMAVEESSWTEWMCFNNCCKI